MFRIFLTYFNLCMLVCYTCASTGVRGGGRCLTHHSLPYSPGTESLTDPAAGLVASKSCFHPYTTGLSHTRVATLAFSTCVLEI